MLGVIATIPVGSFPSPVAFTPDGARAYVVNKIGETVSVIDTATKTVTDTIGFAGAYPADVVIHPDGSRVYVSRLGAVSVVDTTTNMVSAYVEVSDSWLELAIHPDGTKLYAAGGYPDATMVAIDTATNTVAATISVDDPSGPAMSPDGTRVYVNSSDALSVIDTASNSVVTSFNAGEGLRDGVVSPDGTRVYVTDQTSTPHTVTVFNTATGAVTATIPVGVQPTGIAVHPDGSRVYVVKLNGEMLVISTTTNTVTTTIPVGNSAGDVAVTPDGSTLYVTNFYHDTVSVISHLPSWQWPGHLPELVGDLFGGVAGDGGGWLVIGGHFYPIPPRPLSMAIIARAAAPHLGKPIENRKLGQQLRNMLRR